VERRLIRARILECEERMTDQRKEIALMERAGSDVTSAINVLSAMEGGQALRLRRLAALA
jgi:hypothetical protein